MAEISIDKVNKKIIEIIEQSEAQIVKIFDQSNGEDYFVAQAKLGSLDVIIKIVSKKHHKAKNISKEILAYQIIKEHNSKKDNLHVYAPEMISSGENEDFFWEIRELIKGRTLSSTDLAYDQLANSLVSKELIKKIIDNYKSFASIKLGSNLSKLKTFSYCVKMGPKEIEGDYASEENMKISFGDLNPGNIIIGEDGNVYFTDLEWVSWDNYMMDVAYFWAFLWRDLDFQKEWYNQFVVTEQDKSYFWLSLRRMFAKTNWDDKEFFENPLFKDRNEQWYKYYKETESFAE